MKKTRKLRELFNDGQVIKIVGAHDGLSARLVDESGFDGIWASGLEISASHCVPDANILTMTEYLERASEMNEATRIPVVADCDTGYGNSNNAIHMVRKYESAGIAGVCIEDKLFPKVNSYVPGRQELAPIAEFVGKIMACKNAQTDPDFMLIARVEALIAGHGMEEALKRAHAYVDAGADAILIHSKEKTPDEIREFCRLWKSRAPLVVVPTSYPDFHVDEMPALGIRTVIYANHGLRASIRAMKEAFAEIRQAGSLRSVDSKIVPMSEVFRLQGMLEMKESEKKYLKSEADSIAVVIPAAGDHSYEPSMKDIAAGFPVAMLDINGKSVLQRNRETLKSLGIPNISVVTGYSADKFNVEGVRYVSNLDYKNTRQIDSILLGTEGLPKEVNRFLVCMSDVLFDASVVRQLVEARGDLVLAIDPSMPKKTYSIDSINVGSPPVRTGGRRLGAGRTHKIQAIGKDLQPLEAHYEFTGMFCASRNGLELIRNAYKELQIQQERDSSDSAPKPDMLTVFQALIDSGIAVTGLEIHQGWIEIRNFENYKAAHTFYGDPTGA